MKIYALLVGINDYPVKPLAGCVGDVGKIESYLKSLKLKDGNGLPALHIHKLLNEKATKDGIKKGIGEFLSKAGDDDVALFYYSGHGAHEDAGGKFREEHDGMLECLVSYYSADQASGYLLADKEIRYLFSKLPNNPHLVSVFDACHSGDMVRAGGPGEIGQVKRLSGNFPTRDYQEFIFSEAITENQLSSGTTAKLIPVKNSVHIAACSAGELSWEDNDGGIFTRYLLELLRATNNQISYMEIARWANISLKDITEKKQSPTINIQGAGKNAKLTGTSPWLKLHDGSSVHNIAQIGYNKSKGWILNRGSLLGVKVGDEVTIDPENKALTADQAGQWKMKVTKVEVDISQVEDPLDKGLELDRTHKYPVALGTTHSKLTLYLNNVDGLPEDQKKVKHIIEGNKEIELSEAAGGADFFVNIFNELVFISLPGNPFQPLVEQISLIIEDKEGEIEIKDEAKLKEELQLQLRYLIKWNHFNTLENTDPAFDKSPIKVEIQVQDKFGDWPEDKDWTDITNGEISIDPYKDRIDLSAYDYGEIWGQHYKIKVSNVANFPVHVGVLQLSSDLGIIDEPWGKEVITLQNKGDFKMFFYQNEDNNNQTGIYLDSYKEVYNWKQEWLHYKFIYTNYKNFTTSFDDYLQSSLEHPLVISRRPPHDIAGSKLTLPGSRPVLLKKSWGTLKTTIRLNNPEYNIVSGDLEDLWEYYINNEKLAPFISRLYLDNQTNGLLAESKQFPNRVGNEVGSKGLIDKMKVGLGNFLDNRGRKRKFKRARKSMTDKPIIVAEGDSWFLYPILVKDILDYVMMEFPVLSIAAAGDELGNYKADGHLLQSVAEVQPKYVLISGGGNDIIGPEIENLLAENIPAGKTAREYLNEKFDENMAKLRKLYQFFITELKKHQSVKQLFLHGYDYIRTDHPEQVVKKGWVNRYMLAKNIQAAEDRDRVIRLLIDTFNGILIELTKDDPFVTYLDLRGQVPSGMWFDEIHPDDEGYQILGNIFIEKINEFETKENI